MTKRPKEELGCFHDFTFNEKWNNLKLGTTIEQTKHFHCRHVYHILQLKSRF